MRTLLMRAVALLSFVSLLLTSNAAGQARQAQNKPLQVEKQFVNPRELHRPGSYTHVVSVSQGKLIFVSGQVALNKDGGRIGKGDLRAQATQVFENLQISFALAGATFSEVIKMNTYVVNYKPADVARFAGLKFQQPKV